LEIFDALGKAVARRQQVELSYRKPGTKCPEARTVDPYHLANVNGEWFLFAFDHARRQIRKFVPARIQAIKRTGKTFERSKKFSLERELRDSFGVHSGEGEFEVVIRFNPRAADYIREKKMARVAAIARIEGRRVELKLKLSSLVEIERWILSWAGDAKVLKRAGWRMPSGCPPGKFSQYDSISFQGLQRRLPDNAGLIHFPVRYICTLEKFGTKT